jgi:peptidyl-prolyl cis-trans isomerase D
MFATIRRHQTWLWVIIMGVTIVTFVIFFTPGATSLGRGPTGNLGTIYGRPITVDQWRDARREVELEYLFRLGDWLGHDAFSRQFLDRVDDEVRQRLVLLEKADQFHIRVGDDAVARWISARPAFADRRTKVFSQEAYDQFVQRFLPTSPNIRLDESDFARYARHQIALGQLESLAGLSGELVPLREGEAEYRYRHEEAVAEIAEVSLTNYLAAVTLRPAEVAKFYTNRLAVYRVPERVQVSYVKFSASNHLAEADAQLAKETNLAERIESIYDEQGPDAYRDAQNHTLPAALAKAAIKKRIREQLALRAAVTNADHFARQLFALEPAKAANLDRLAATNGLAVHLTEPFSEADGPKGIDLDTFTKSAFGLTADEPFAAPIKGDDCIYLIAFHQRLPSEIPPLSAIRRTVEADYRHDQALQMAHAAGQSLYLSVTNGLAKGRSFQSLCAADRADWFKPPPFSRSTDSLPTVESQGIDLRELKDVAFALTAHAVSHFSPTREGGFLVYVQSFRPVDPTKMKAELPDFLASLRHTLSVQAFEQWFRQQYTAAHVTSAGGKDH